MIFITGISDTASLYWNDPVDEMITSEIVLNRYPVLRRVAMVKIRHPPMVFKMGISIYSF